ncbi:hypothetical protein K3F44_18185 [Pseudomonas sp. S07E 245]|uniref:hypothetical protein n=1 Tax=Pseudomonas sp. S07E 245 TaxID=2866278 RepID=UPI001C734F2A|nr:hypothetical protein [Pseudomonas sp. S07E 245]QYX51520.1 hypothetical protein K3F44_18185 [Pseudomonas sp. S07E 245]
MDNLVGVLCLAVGVGTWWWLAGRMKKRGRGWLTRQVAGSFACCFMAIFVAALAVSTGIVESKSAEQANAASAPEQKNVVAKVEIKTLRMTPDTYAQRINQLLEKYEKPYRVDPSEITEGEVQNILKANLGPYASLVAGVSKETGELVDVTLIGAGDGKPMSGLEIMLIASAALSAATPDADSRDIFKKLPELLKGNDQTYGQVKLSVKSTDMMGTWFMAAPI